jgi:hypothetical protein
MNIGCGLNGLARSLRAILLGGVFSGWVGMAGAEIPLSLVKVPDAGGGHRQQLWIYLGINNRMDDGVPVVRPYLFDTGSSMFNAAWYSGENDNPNAWSPGATLLADTTYGYGAGSDSLNVVSVSSIQVYQNASATTPVYNFDPTAINPASSGYVVGQVYDSTMPPNPHHPSFQHALQHNASPYVSGVFGTFGAGMFTSTVGSNPNTVAVGSVLGQSTTTGWAVVANTPSTSQPFVILGLDEATRAQFSSQVEWDSTSTTPFPNSGAASGKEFDTMFHYSVINGSSEATWSAATLLDTGTADTNIYSMAAHASLAGAGLLTHEGEVIDMSTFTATGNSTLDPNQPFSFVGGFVRPKQWRG